MSEEPGPDPLARVRALMLHTVDSYEKLEIIVFLAAATGPIDVSAIAAAVPARTSVVEEALSTLAASAIVIEAPRGAWRLHSSGPWSDVIAELVTLYARDRVTLVNMMTQTALQRLRDMSARAVGEGWLRGKTKKGDPDR